MKFVRPVLSLVSSPRLQEKSGGAKMALIVDVEIVPAGIKPPAVDDSLRTSTGRKYGSGASAPLLTTSPMYFLGAIKRGSAIMLKLVKFVRQSSILAEELSPTFARSGASSTRLSCSTIREGGDTIPSPGRSPKQPLPGIGL